MIFFYLYSNNVKKWRIIKILVRRPGMLRVRIVLLCLVVMLISGVALEAIGQNESRSEDAMCVPMGDIVITPPASVEQTRSPVNFPHSRHFGADCRTCHHAWAGNAKIRNCTTAGCHDQTTSPKTQTTYLKYTGSSIAYFKYAFHGQCVGCHKEIKQKRKTLEMSKIALKDKLPATGPTSCSECHPK